MRILIQLTAAAAAFLAGMAVAKLPPPTPEALAAAAAEKAKQEEQLKKEQELLTQAQDRVAARFGQPGKGTAERTATKDLPKTNRELPRGTGPRGGREPSAEAHSGLAK
jgi:hypothetical protein